MDLKLNVSKKGLSTQEEVINEEYTLRYGHIFRGKSAYEYAVEGGFVGSEEEYEAYVGNIGNLSEEAKEATIEAKEAVIGAQDAREQALVAADMASSAGTRADKATENAENATQTALDAAERANKAAENAESSIITIDKELSPTSDNAIANSAVVNGLAGLAEGVSTAIGQVSENVEQNTADIKTKQDTLTLTTKPNGNIVIGNLAGQTKEFMPATPSGDPMHYAYEAVGAVWNASTGYWSYRAEEGGLSDLTNADMRLAYAEAYLSTVVADGVRFGGTARLLINKTEWASAKEIGNSYCKNNYLEVAEIARKHNNCIFTTAYNSFNYNPKLHTILGILDYSYSAGAKSAPPYKECYALRNITIMNLKHNISFAYSPLLSKESLLYMINNCASNVTITITLHLDVWTKCQEGGEWHSEIKNALTNAVNKGTTITLASA